MLNDRRRNILLQVSGSIAAFKAVSLCSKLVQSGFQVEVVLSAGAEYFVGQASFEGLTKRKVHLGNFDEGSMMAHIDLERWADLILLYPASANTIAKIATGFSNSLIGSLFLAHEFKKPYWILPAMNQAMMAHPATVAHLETLKSWGLKILMPDEGMLACGEIGTGRLIEPEAILTEIANYFKTATSPLTASKKILITSGGTREPIDQVRSITNLSTGQTGYLLSRALLASGYDVTLIQSKFSVFSDQFVSTLTYDTTQDLSAVLHNELIAHSYDYLIHAAAVADYSVEKVMDQDGREILSTTKIQSEMPLLLKLKPNPKIIQKVRDWSRNKNMKLISFKLTAGSESNLKLESYDSEWIIHNELSKVSPKSHEGTLYEKQTTGQYEAIKTFSSKDALSKIILNLIQGDL